MVQKLRRSPGRTGMTVDHKRLRELAEKAGGDEWTPTYSTRTDLARVWLPDGDGIALCFGNIGHLPEPIDADDVAEFIGAACPKAILALLDEIEALRKSRDEVIKEYAKM